MDGPLSRSTRRISAFLQDHPAVTLFFLGVLLSLLVMPPSPLLMVSDSYRRFLVAGWIAGGLDPQGFLPGVDNVKHQWWGIGQSVLFAPFDRIFLLLGAATPDSRFILTAWLLFPLINGSVFAVAWYALRELGFTCRKSTMGIVIFILTTTILFHFQNNQENPMMLSCALGTIVAICRWDKTRSLAWLNLACALQAWNVIVRIPNLAFVLPLFGLPFLGRILDRTRQTEWRKEIRDLLTLSAFAIPWTLFALFVDRWWHWLRFGTWSGTGYSIAQKWAMETFNDLPPGYPYSVRFIDGFVGHLFSPAKGVFFYEPLVGLVIAFWFVRKATAPPKMKGLVIISVVAILGSMIGLARLAGWNSEPNWGPRHVATPCHLLELGLGAWLVSNVRPRSWVGAATGAFVAIAFLVQVSGFWWPAYHENVVMMYRKGPEYLEFTTRLWSKGLGWTDPDSNTDWRFLDRPIGVAKDVVRQLTLPTEQWVETKPPFRMIWITSPLQSLSIPVRWSVRLVWLVGLGLAVLLGRLAIIGSTRIDLAPSGTGSASR